MIKLTATALVHSVSPVLQVNSSFQKRELVLNDSWERDGEVHDNFVLIEFVGDKMPMLDTIAPGQRVTVEAFVNGREYQGRYFTTLRGLSVAPYQQAPQQAAPPQQAPQPQGYAAGGPTAANLPFPPKQ